MVGRINRDYYWRNYNIKAYVLDNMIRKSVDTEDILDSNTMQAMTMLIGLGLEDKYADIYKEMRREYKRRNPNIKNKLVLGCNKHDLGCGEWVHTLMEPSSVTFEVLREEHKTKRIEGNYEGIITVPSCVGTGVARKCVLIGDCNKHISNIVQKMKVIDRNTTKEMIDERIIMGDMLVYDLSLKGSWLANNIGCMVFTRDNESALDSLIVLNDNALEINHINKDAVIHSLTINFNNWFDEFADTSIIHNIV